MDLVEAADRAQLALTKCPRQWYIKQLCNHTRIMMIAPKHLSAATITGEEQCPTNRPRERAEDAAEIRICPLPIAHMESECLSDAWFCPDRKTTTLGLHAQESTYQIITHAIVWAILVDHDACHQTRPSQL